MLLRSLNSSLSEMDWHRDRVRCGVTRSHCKLFLDIIDMVSSGLKRKWTVHIVTQAKLKPAPVMVIIITYYYGVEVC